MPLKRPCGHPLLNVEVTYAGGVDVTATSTRAGVVVAKTDGVDV
jgi:hypothetical protein